MFAFVCGLVGVGGWAGGRAGGWMRAWAFVCVQVFARLCMRCGVFVSCFCVVFGCLFVFANACSFASVGAVCLSRILSTSWFRLDRHWEIKALTEQSSHPRAASCEELRLLISALLGPADCVRWPSLRQTMPGQYRVRKCSRTALGSFCHVRLAQDFPLVVHFGGLSQKPTAPTRTEPRSRGRAGAMFQCVSAVSDRPEGPETVAH